jgi:hypothetical protein
MHQQRNDTLARDARKWFRKNPRPGASERRAHDPGRVIRRMLINAHELYRLQQRAGGLLFGTIPGGGVRLPPRGGAADRPGLSSAAEGDLMAAGIRQCHDNTERTVQ